MPIRRVGRSGGADTRHNLRQRVRSVGGPEAHRLRVEIDVIGKVVPGPSFQLGRPMRGPVNTPTELVVFTARRSTQKTVFQLGEMALYQG